MFCSLFPKPSSAAFHLTLAEENPPSYPVYRANLIVGVIVYRFFNAWVSGRLST
jgi:hypothetical protein